MTIGSKQNPINQRCLKRWYTLDDDYAWCEQYEHCEIFDNVEDANCEDCFRAVEEYNLKVQQRWNALIAKQ